MKDQALTSDNLRLRQLAAWCVHLYTASGLVLAGMIAVFIVRGDTGSLFWSLGLMWLATVIDATDGVLARRARVKEVLPAFDGRRLDDLTDFLTYTFLPLLFLWRSGIFTASQSYLLLVPLIASAYGFCQVSAKTDDGYFLGFPSYWNIVAMYVFILSPPATLSLAIILGFAALTFVPAKYLYPSQPGKLNQLTNVVGGIWSLHVGYMLYLGIDGLPGMTMDDLQRHAMFSLIFPALYLATSWYLSLRRRP